MSNKEWEKQKALRRDPGMGHGHGRRGEKPKNTRKTLKRLIGLLSGRWPLVIVAVSLTILGSLGVIAATYMLKPMINSLADAAPIESYIVSLIQMAGIYLVSAISTWAGNRLMVHVAQLTTFRMRNDLFSHAQKLPLSYFDSRTHGELMSRFTNDVDNVNVTLENSLSQVVASVINVVGVFIMMVILSPLLTVAVVGMVFVIFFAIKFITKRSARYFREQQKRLGILNGAVEEMMVGQKVIKVFNHETQTLDEFDELNEDLRRASTSAQTFGGVLMPVMGNLSYILYAVIAMGGAIMAINSGLDVGTIAAYLNYTRMFTQPISNLANQFNVILSGLAGAERIFNVLDEEVELDTGKVTLSKEDSKWYWNIPQEDGSVEKRLMHGDIRFDSVTFGYTPEKGVLKSITLYAKPGQKIAFVGSTGAGKTTITNLINRFYEIQDGAITYDGIEVKDIRKSDLRRALGMVLQDVHLFKGTIRDNIRYGKLDATDEEIERAAKIANAHSFIMQLPDGYDTELSADGENLSQGQRQLLSIARAAVADPPVLILDEATSSVDTRTEHLIEKGMDQLMHGRTTLAIAHRLSTVRNANAIMVLENGEIIERGDHDELLDQNGRYYELYTGISQLS